MDLDATADLVRARLSGTIALLRRPELLGRREYHRLLDKLHQELIELLREANLIANTLLHSIEGQYAIHGHHIPPTHHMFEINFLCMMNINNLNEETVIKMYNYLIKGLSLHAEIYNLLRCLDKIIRKYILKQFETEILRKMQSLAGPSDKKCLRLVVTIITYIINNWDTEEEHKSLFDTLFTLMKWSKLEFYICSNVLDKLKKDIPTYQIILERIFQGFQENHTAYAANLLLKDVLAACVDNEELYKLIEDDVTSLLEQEITQRTLHSSILTYVIPTMSHGARSKFIKRSPSFKLIYRLQVIKHYCHKNYLTNVDIDLIHEITAKELQDRSIISLVWDMCCMFTSSERYVQEEHFRLLMKCIKTRFTQIDENMQHNIHAFLSQVLISMIENNRPLYIEFYLELDKFVRSLPEKYSRPRKDVAVQIVMEIHARTLFLMSQSYLSIKAKVPIRNNAAFNTQENPLREVHERYLDGGWDIIKQVVLRGVGGNYIYDLIDPYKFSYDHEFTVTLKESLMALLSNPNLDKLENIRTYTKILKKIYQDYGKTHELERLLDDVLNYLLGQYNNIKGAEDIMIYLANPVYTSAESLTVIAKDYIGEEAMLFLFNLCEDIITNTLTISATCPDVYAKKFIDEIFTSHLELLRTSVLRFCDPSVHNPPLDKFLYLCEQVMCQTKLRRATSVALKCAFQIVKFCQKPLNTGITNYLIDRLNNHLEEVEQAAINRCSGNKEMILLTFKVLASEPDKFVKYFSKMLTVSQGYQDLHLNAIEAICSESKLKDLTAPFLVQVFRKTISVMEHPNFTNRNCATQLIQLLANRFMGTKSELGNRPLGVLHVFERYPELADICYETLYGENNDSKFGVLTFIGDTPYYSSLFGEKFSFPRDKIGELIDTPGLKMLATRVFAMTVNASRLYSTIFNAISELHNEDVSPCSLLFVEYLLVRLMNLNADEELIQDAITRFENLLTSPGVIGVPGCTKYLRYPDCEMTKIYLKHMLGTDTAEEVQNVISKCLFSENNVGLVFVCFYTETIFHRLNEAEREILTEKLVQVLFENNGCTYVTICQYYLTIKNIICCYPEIKKIFIIDVNYCYVRHVFTAEIITFILKNKKDFSECEKNILKGLKDNLPILFKDCDTDDETVCESIVTTLLNITYLFPKVDLSKSDFYYLLFIAMFHVSEKENFSDLFHLITGKNEPVSYQIQRLPKIIKDDLNEEYPVFIKNVAEYVCSNLGHFFVEYTRLYDCPEQYINVKIDSFLLNLVLEELRKY